MKRITPQVKAIADAHIKAKQDGKFDNIPVKTKDEVLQALMDGKTFSEVLSQIEIRFCSITSILMSHHFDYTSQSYRTAVYKGFKSLLQN